MIIVIATLIALFTFPLFFLFFFLNELWDNIMAFLTEVKTVDSSVQGTAKANSGFNVPVLSRGFSSSATNSAPEPQNSENQKLPNYWILKAEFMVANPNII